MSNPNEQIFGTDGVRGLANTYPMTSDLVLQLGRAAAAVLLQQSHGSRIVIGKDTRLSGYMLETALASGITSMGIDVMLVGPLPTPGVAFITRGMRAGAGVVISGSHNNWKDNGIKFFDHEGFKLKDVIERQIEKAILSNEIHDQLVESAQIGKAMRVDDATGRYIQFLKGTFPQHLSLDGLKVVIDCSNGAGYKVAPAVLEELGADVVTIGVEPDGTNINDNCGSLHTETLCRAVVKEQADCGIALDGDADRVIMCDEHGEIVDGDVIMALCASYFKAQGKLNNSTLVATVMSNLALDYAMEKEGIRVIKSNVGDKYVVQKMREEGLNVGGEQSGHLIFLDHNTTGDGCLSGLTVLSIMLEQNRPLSEIRKIFEPFPTVQHNIFVREKVAFENFPDILQVQDWAAEKLGDRGRYLLRYSGTEKIARIMVESDDEKLLHQVANELIEVVQKKLGSQEKCA